MKIPSVFLEALYIYMPLGEEEGSYAYLRVGGKEVGIITLMQTPTLWILKKMEIKK
jgi:hypothetical protein